MREVGYASSYAFKYSARPGTPAAQMDSQIDETVKVARLTVLQALLERQRQTFNQVCVGQRFEVLLEKRGRREGQLVGRSPYMQAAFAEGEPSWIGAMAEIEILAAGPNSLEGRIVSAPS